MGLAPGTLGITDNMEDVSVAHEVANDMKRGMFDPKFAGLEIGTGFLAAPVGGVLSQIAKATARRQLVESAKRLGTIKKKGHTPYFWDTAEDLERRRANLGTALRDLNKMPQKALDSTEAMEFVEDLGHNTYGMTNFDRTISISNRMDHRDVAREGRSAVKHETSHARHLDTVPERGRRRYTTKEKRDRRVKEMIINKDTHHVMMEGNYQQLYGEVPVEHFASNLERRLIRHKGPIGKKTYMRLYDEELENTMDYMKSRPRYGKYLDEARKAAKGFTRMEREGRFPREEIVDAVYE